MEDRIKAGEYTKIPTATDVNNGNSSSSGSVLLPIGLAVGVAGATGLAASKIIQKKKEEEEITLEDEEFEEETETYEDDDYGTVDEEPVEKYHAGNVNQDGTVIKNGYEIGTDIPVEDTLDFTS